MTNETTKRIETMAAFSTHCDNCPLGCGIDYQRGRCAEGDVLAEAMDSARGVRTLVCCLPAGCNEPAFVVLFDEANPETHACAAHVWELVGPGMSLLHRIVDGVVEDSATWRLSGPLREEVLA